MADRKAEKVLGEQCGRTLVVSSDLDGSGRVSVYVLADRRWRSISPIDANEQLRHKSVSLQEPQHLMSGPGGDRVVRDSQVKQMETQRYKIKTANFVVDDRAVLAPKDDTSRPANTTETALLEYTLKELREFAAEVSLQGGHKKKKTELARLLAASGFVPPQAPTPDADNSGEEHDEGGE